eukprot:8102344-Lingulodinium_polyedra.AAC.1
MDVWNIPLDALAQEKGKLHCRSRNAQTGNVPTPGGFSWCRPTGMRNGRNRCLCSVTGVLWAPDR